MKKVLLLTLFLGISALGFAQRQPEIGERWLMNERLIDLVDNYERFSRFEGRSDSYSFLSLFRRPDVKVFCDYMASTDFGKEISVSDYVTLSQELADRFVQISDIRHGPYEYKDGHWHTMLEFNKRIDYEDEKGYTFSTNFPIAGGDYHIVAECVWMEDNEEFQIESINGRQNPSSSFPEGKFLIVQRKNEIDNRVLSNGKPLVFNDYGFSIQGGNPSFEFDDDDYLLTQNLEQGTDRYDILTFNMVPKRFRARGRLSLSPFGAYAVTTASEDVKASSFAVEAGADIGYALSLAKSTKLAIYTGLGFSFSSISLSAENISYGYDITTSGATGEPFTYRRTYDLQKVTEGIVLTDIAIPFFASLEHNFGKKLAIVADAGVKIYLNTTASARPYHILGTVLGQEEEAYTIDQDFDRFVAPNQNTLNQFSVSLMAKAGIDYAFATGKYAFIHVGYEHGLTESYSPEALRKWFDAGGIYPLVYYNGADVAVHSFLSGVSYRRGGVVMEAGIRIKFGKN